MADNKSQLSDFGILMTFLLVTLLCSGVWSAAMCYKWHLHYLEQIERIHHDTDELERYRDNYSVPPRYRPAPPAPASFPSPVL